MNDGRQPVTREELREELARFPTREELREELTRFPTREELREELTRFPTREELKQTLDAALEPYVTKTEFSGFVQLMIAEHEKAEQRYQELMIEIGRAARVAAEENRREIGVLDDRYRDLPDRVGALERGLREHVEDAAAHGRRPRRKR